MKEKVFFWMLCTLLSICIAHKSSSETCDENATIQQNREKSDFRYIFTAPRTLKTGGSNELHFRRFGNLEKGVLKVQVFYKKDYNSLNETIAAKKKFSIPKGEKEVTLSLPIDKIDEYVYNGRLQINGSFEGNEISGSDTVSFAVAQTEIIIIQTDKPLYQPGQTVAFRVLKLNKHLKPSTKNKKADVYVEDSKGTRLFQFLSLDLDNGMIQKEFPLSVEPVLGSWTIKVVTKDTTKTTSFIVKNYVLPKYDVNIKFPPFVLANAEVIPIEICAKYTYGKPVVGTLNLNASLESYYYYYDSQDKFPTLQESFKIDGCYTYELKVSKIELDNQYSYRRIQIVANVIEEGTGVSRNATEYLQRTTSPLNLDLSNSPNNYKPGLFYYGKLKVSNPDNTPADNEPIGMCITISKKRVIAKWWATKTLQICKNYTSDSDGMIAYIIPPQNIDVISITIDAKSLKYARDPNDISQGRNNILTQPQTSKYLNSYYSPSGSFIQFQPVEQPISCESTLSLPLLFTSNEDARFKFYYQVLRQSVVVDEGVVKKSFSVDKDDVSSQYLEDDTLLDGEVKQLDPPAEFFPTCEDNCPAAEKSHDTSPIGEVVINIPISSSLSPIIRIMVYYIRPDDEVVADSVQITIQNCFSNEVEFKFGDKVQQPGLETKVEVKAAPNSLCGIKAIDKSITLLDNSDQLTAESVFQMVGQLDINQYYTNNPCYNSWIQPGLENAALKSIIRPPIMGSSSYEDSLSAFQTSGFLVISDLLIVTRPCTTSAIYGGGGGGIRFSKARVAFDGAAMAMPEGNVISSTVSVSAVRDFFPETWLFEMEMTNSEGLFVTNKTLPDTITEWIGSAVCINSENGLGISNTTGITAFQPFFIDYTLPVSVIRGEVFVVRISIYNYVNAALPLTITLDQSDGFQVVGDSINGDICVDSNTSKIIPVPLKATKVGKVNITVHAETSKSATICGDSPVSDSYAKDAIVRPIEVEPEGFPGENVINSLFCPDEENNIFETTISLTLPEDLVPDSERAYVDVTGNIMGPAINNLNSLVRMPTGCGEQNMVMFNPNYLVLDYLKDIGMLTSEIEAKAINYLNTGYQRELTYRHDDGSFSAFGMSDKEGSTFLTAFVLRSFYEAKNYIYIDENILKQAQDWLVSKQTPDGCFPNVGRIIDIEIQGGLKDSKSSGSTTAYVLASLLISNYANETIINAGFDCLDKNPPTNPYAQLLYAYAEVLASKTEKAQNYLDEARQRINNTGGMEYFITVNGTKSIEIEANAYAILTTLSLNGKAQNALSYVRFLTSNLNPNGGFRSTQDTCVGLKALSKFAKIVYKDPLKLQLTFSGGLKQSVSITDENKFLVQRFKISDVPCDLNMLAKGTGCGLLQSVVRFNTKTSPSKKMFSLEVKGECLDKACTSASIHVLTSYLPSGLKSGMSILEVKLITGFVAEKDSLDKLKSDASNNILRIDVQNNVVVIYFSELSNTVQNVLFDVTQVVEVRNAQPGTAKVYDYYANENTASTSYVIQEFHNEDNTV